MDRKKIDLKLRSGPSESILSVRGCQWATESIVSEASDSNLSVCGKATVSTVSEGSIYNDSIRKDVCAICYSTQGSTQLATHFCEDCGVLGHFLCESCLEFHKQFTTHTHVKSIKAAEYRERNSTQIDFSKENSMVSEETRVAILTEQDKRQNDSELQQKILKLTEKNTLQEREIDEMAKTIKSEAKLNNEKAELREKLVETESELRKYKNRLHKTLTKRSKGEEQASKPSPDDLVQLSKTELKNLLENDFLKNLMEGINDKFKELRSHLADAFKTKTGEINKLKDEIKESERKYEEHKSEKGQSHQPQAADQLKAKTEEVSKLKTELEEYKKLKGGEQAFNNLLENELKNLTKRFEERLDDKLKELFQ